MTKRQDLYLQRRSRSDQSDQLQPNQAKSIPHEPRASPDSAALTSRIEFPTMTGTGAVPNAEASSVRSIQLKRSDPPQPMSRRVFDSGSEIRPRSIGMARFSSPAPLRAPSSVENCVFIRPSTSIAKPDEGNPTD